MPPSSHRRCSIGAGEGQPAVPRDARETAVRVGERQEDGEQRHVGPAEVHEVGEDLVAEGVPETARELAQREAAVLERGGKRAQRRGPAASAVTRTGPALSGGERDVQVAAGAQRPRELADGRCVHRERLEEVGLEAVDVGVHGHRPPVGRDDGAEVLGVVEGAVVDDPEVLPQPVDGGRRARAGEPGHAAVEQVALAAPRGAQAAGQAVHLEDGRAVAAAGGVDAGREAGHTAADDDETALRGGHDAAPRGGSARSWLARR